MIEATGSYQGFPRALELVRPEGTVVLKTTVVHPTAFDLSVPVINEINTMPGFTSISMYPRMWEAAGIGYSELVSILVQTALARGTGLR